MSTHKISAERSGSYNGTDWEVGYIITFEYRKGRPARFYLNNGDPGYPADPDEVEAISIVPEYGSFDDARAERDALEWAQEWLSDKGYDAALKIVIEDGERHDA